MSVRKWSASSIKSSFNKIFLKFMILCWIGHDKTLYKMNIWAVFISQSPVMRCRQDTRPRCLRGKRISTNNGWTTFFNDYIFAISLCEYMRGEAKRPTLVFQKFTHHLLGRSQLLQNVSLRSRVLMRFVITIFL